MTAIRLTQSLRGFKEQDEVKFKVMSDKELERFNAADAEVDAAILFYFFYRHLPSETFRVLLKKMNGHAYKNGAK